MSIIDNNRYNFNPNIWGPKGWFFLDTIILSYPDNPTNEQKQYFANLLYNIENILPCYKCRINYKHHIDTIPLTDEILQNRENLLNWWIKMHNLSRIMMNKKVLSFDSFIEFYNKEYKIKKYNNDNRYYVKNIVYLSIFILLLIFFKDYIFKWVKKYNHNN